jgi:GNAT superfamily N-acetyltransferase
MERLADAVIIAAGPGDAADIGRVHVRSWRETYPGLLPQTYLAAMRPEIHARRIRQQLSRPKPGEVVLAAESPAGVIGYCAGALISGVDRLADAEVFTLYLVKSGQGRGVGRRLLQAAAMALAAQGARSLVIWVLSGNKPARAFYERLGGVAVRKRPVSGWGGGLMETAYRWSDIGALARA